MNIKKIAFILLSVALVGIGTFYYIQHKENFHLITNVSNGAVGARGGLSPGLRGARAAVPGGGDGQSGNGLLASDVSAGHERRPPECLSYLPRAPRGEPAPAGLF